jgi:hypothetical protein
MQVWRGDITIAELAGIGHLAVMEEKSLFGCLPPSQSAATVER